jgi:hypothetical protein
LWHVRVARFSEAGRKPTLAPDADDLVEVLESGELNLKI